MDLQVKFENVIELLKLPLEVSLLIILAVHLYSYWRECRSSFDDKKAFQSNST